MLSANEGINGRVGMKVLNGMILGMVLLVPVGCVNYSGDSGVENRWRSESIEDWKVGKSTEQDIVTLLGPPSQLIRLEKETVYYYLRERQSGKGLFLMLYNWRSEKLTYDRAVFFFGRDGKLTKYSFSPEALPYAGD